MEQQSVTRDLIAEIEEGLNCSSDWSWMLAELVGPKQLWLGTCRQAVAQGRRDWLARFLPEQADPHWFLDLMAYRSPECQEVASAIAACAQVALLMKQFSSLEIDPVRAAAVAESLHEAAVKWQWAQLLDPGDVGELRARAVCAMRRALGGAELHQQQAEAMVRELTQIQKLATGSRTGSDPLLPR